MGGDRKSSPAERVARWNARYADRELVWSAGPNEALVEIVESLSLDPGRALDLACGEGRNALWLAETGWDVTAVDFSDVAIDKARRIGDRRGVGVDWVVGDVTTWRPPAAAYDLVVVLFLHTDAVDRDRWLSGAWDAVAPGGVLVYVGHDLDNLTRGHGGPQSPEVLVRAADVTARLPGAEILRAEAVERPLAVEPEHGQATNGTAETGIAIDTVVVARRRAVNRAD